MSDPIKSVRIPEKYFENVKPGTEDDIGVLFNAWRAYLKDINYARLLTFEADLEDVLRAHPKVKNYVRRTDYHCTFNYWNLHVSYYPSKGKWVMNNNKAVWGSLEDMINYLDKRAVIYEQG
jgi:hypothetical protein